MRVKGKIGGAVPAIETEVEAGVATIYVHVGNLSVILESGRGPGAVKVTTTQGDRTLDVDNYAIPVVVPGKAKATATKANPARPARASRRKNDDKDYTHYVLTADNQINSGWHYADDAKDALKDGKSEGRLGAGARVLARVTLVRMGKDPKVNTNWQFRA